MPSFMPITHHRRNIDNPGNLGACKKWRIRFMTAITPAYAHAYQFICLAGHIPAAFPSKFRLPVAKARFPHLPIARATTREKGNDFHGWAIYIDGGTPSADGETLAGWCVVARSLHGRIYVMFGPVVTTEAHLAYAGARIHSDNTADMSAIIEALSFLGPSAGSPVKRFLASSVIQSMLLVFVWVQCMLAHMFSLDSSANSYY